MTLDILCARCACVQKTCCQDSEIFVTLGDVARIREHTGADAFWQYAVPTDPVYLNEHDDPIWMENAFQPDGTRRVLQKMANDDCTFLTSSGCCLPLEVRPLVCRLYPYDYTADGLKSEPASGCPRQLLRDGESVFEAVGVERESALRWHRMLYDELLQERPQTRTAGRCE